MQHRLSNPIIWEGEELVNTTERACSFIYNTKTALKILEDMFTVFDGRQVRKNTIFLKALVLAMSDIEYPSFDDIWKYAGREYADSTIKQNRSWIKKSGWLDDEVFGKRFWNEYQKRLTEHIKKKEKMVALKNDAEMRHQYDVDAEYDYANTMDVLRGNPHVTYSLPDLTPHKLNYFDTFGIQVLKLNHVGGNPVVQLPLSYHYRCNKCGFETDLAFDVKSVSCSGEDCGSAMMRVKSQDIVRPAYASMVVTDDLNSISIVSLTKIPQGEFIGAVFLCRNKADYYLFMIATEAIEPTSSTIEIDQNSHAIWQIIALIDQQHESRIGKHIHGLDWYKAAILLAYLANRKGRVSTNVLIVGDPGVGKTSTLRLYMATLTAQQKIVAATQLTGPGIHGSMMQIKVGETTVNVPELGFFSRNSMVGIDELLENVHLLPQLKGALMSSTISREVAANRTQTTKRATAIATSNTIPAVLKSQIEWMDRWLNAEDDNHFSYSAHPAKDAMIEEWTLRGLEWRTGQTLADMDRYPLIFFVRDQSSDITMYDLGGEDNSIDDIRLAKMLYDADINEYFNFCGRVEVDWVSHSSRILKLVQKLRSHDNIHSKKRLGQNITLMLQLSAQINGRAELIDEDFEFVEELWKKTCEWIEVSDLLHRSPSCPRTTKAWTIKSIKKEIHHRMSDFKGSPRYYMTETGFSIISAKIEDMGAPAGLISDTIERYKDNQNQ